MTFYLSTLKNIFHFSQHRMIGSLDDHVIGCLGVFPHMLVSSGNFQRDVSSHVSKSLKYNIDIIDISTDNAVFH